MLRKAGRKCFAEAVPASRAAGIAGFVTKPISRKKIEAAILSIGEGFLHGTQNREIGG